MSRRAGILVSSCVVRSRRSRPSTYHSIYRDYLRRYGPEIGPEAEWFGKRRRSLAEAIACAAKSELPSRHAPRMGRLVVHEHQRRVGKRRLARLTEILAAEEKAIAEARSFPALLKIVERAADQVKGIGALTCYDVAHRIGGYKGIRPDARRISPHGDSTTERERWASRTVAGRSPSRRCPRLSIVSCQHRRRTCCASIRLTSERSLDVAL
jgi:hypothetical protein